MDCRFSLETGLNLNHIWGDIYGFSGSGFVRVVTLCEQHLTQINASLQVCCCCQTRQLS